MSDRGRAAPCALVRTVGYARPTIGMVCRGAAACYSDSLYDSSCRIVLVGFALLGLSDLSNVVMIGVDCA